MTRGTILMISFILTTLIAGELSAQQRPIPFQNLESLLSSYRQQLQSAQVRIEAYGKILGHLNEAARMSADFQPNTGLQKAMERIEEAQAIAEKLVPSGNGIRAKRLLDDAHQLVAAAQMNATFSDRELLRDQIHHKSIDRMQLLLLEEIRGMQMEGARFNQLHQSLGELIQERDTIMLRALSPLTNRPPSE